MLLGGSQAQLVAIEKAKELGCTTILCDYLSDNPGQHIADVFYQVSTTDKEKVLEIARKEKIDGIVAYSSDPAAPTAAYVATQLGLPGAEFDVVRQLCEKQLFRKFLERYDFAVPKSIEISIPYDFPDIDITGFRFPVIVKPTDSSGSKGITVVWNKRELENALKDAEIYSRNKVLIIEEFIQRDHPHVIEAEIFVKDSKVVSWGLINSIRDNNANPLLPAAYSYPLDLPAERKELVKKEIQRFIEATGITSGAFNIEMILDKDNRLFILDAGPRNGGNRLPEYISLISGKDLVEATIKNAIGVSNFNIDLDGDEGGYWGLVVYHSLHKGVYKGISFSPEIHAMHLRSEINKIPGEFINEFKRCNDLIGLGFFHFDSKESMDHIMGNLNDYIEVATN